jgi:hypothetical protein
MRTTSKLYAGIAVMAISLHAQAYPGESIVRDPATGNYTITYQGDSNTTELSQTIFVPSTKIDPAIRSSFRLGEKGVIVYRYNVSNGATAKQAIVDVVLQQIVNPILGETPSPAQLPNLTQADLDAYVAAEAAALASPIGWDGNIARRISQVDWSPKTGTLDINSIHAGNTLSGFGFNSLDLPGMASSRIYGLFAKSEIFGFPDDGPLKDSAILAQLNQLRDNDFIVRPAAVPMVAVPTPFDAAALLGSIQTQMHTWIGMQLLDATFSAQLDRYFQSTISAYGLNQNKVGKKQIQTMLELIKKEQPELGRDEEHESDKSHEKNDDKKPALIDRLAARILDFDLSYVTKRMGGDKDD